MLSPLDREKKDHYILTALAKDNPGDIASNRRENSVQVSKGHWAGPETLRTGIVEAEGKTFTLEDAAGWEQGLLGPRETWWPQPTAGA